MTATQHSNFLTRVPSAMILCCVFAVPGALARSDSDPVFFEAVKLPLGELSVRGPLADQPKPLLLTFKPATDTASIQAAIARLEATGDMYTPALADYAAQLGTALQQQGQHAAALQAFDHCLQIMRRNEGLFSPAQVSVLQSQIESQLALGNMDASAELHQARFSMQQRLHADDPIQLAAAYAALADWEVRYYFHQQQTSQLDWQTEDERALLADRLADAFLHYHTALWNLSTSAKPAPYESKIALERKIAAITLMTNKQHLSNTTSLYAKAGQPSRAEAKRSNNREMFEHGTSALQRVIEYSQSTSEPELIAERMLELADWYLLMNHHEEARALYNKTALLLEEAGTPQERIASIMQAGSPVHDPEKDLAALAIGATPGDFDGYIDVTFDVNRYGEASNTQFDAGTTMLDAAAEQNLLQRIHAERFRPGYAQGAFVDSKDVTLRYYFVR